MKLSPPEFERLAIEQLDLLFRVARRLTRNPAWAEDLVQETYVRALRARDNYDFQEFGIRPWLMRILHNLFLNSAQRETRQPQPLSDEHLEAAQNQSQPNSAHVLPPLDPRSFENMDQELVRAIEQIPQEYSTVLLLWAVEDFSYKEIASALEVPIGTVMSRLHRARQRLSEQLHDFAIEEGIIRK